MELGKGGVIYSKLLVDFALDHYIIKENLGRNLSQVWGLKMNQSAQVSISSL